MGNQTLGSILKVIFVQRGWPLGCRPGQSKLLVYPWVKGVLHIDVQASQLGVLGSIPLNSSHKVLAHYFSLRAWVIRVLFEADSLCSFSLYKFVALLNGWVVCTTLSVLLWLVVESLVEQSLGLHHLIGCFLQQDRVDGWSSFHLNWAQFMVVL